MTNNCKRELYHHSTRKSINRYQKARQKTVQKIFPSHSHAYLLPSFLPFVRRVRPKNVSLIADYAIAFIRPMLATPQKMILMYVARSLMNSARSPTDAVVLLGRSPPRVAVPVEDQENTGQVRLEQRRVRPRRMLAFLEEPISM